MLLHNLSLNSRLALSAEAQAEAHDFKTEACVTPKAGTFVCQVAAEYKSARHIFLSPPLSLWPKVFFCRRFSERCSTGIMGSGSETEHFYFLTNPSIQTGAVKKKSLGKDRGREKKTSCSSFQICLVHQPTYWKVWFKKKKTTTSTDWRLD